MGIKGLLPLLRNVTKTVRLREFKGKRVAIDGYVWLHNGAYTCALDLVNQKYTNKFVAHCMKNIQILKNNGIIPVVVLDGGSLPAKQAEEADRASKRAENKRKGDELYRQGSKSEAYRYYASAVDITPSLARQWILELRKNNIEYVVAPYEADAQLAWLAKTGQVDAVMTSDSDLLAYGVPTVLYKYSVDKETVEVIKFQDAVEFLLPCNPTEEAFMSFCVLLGCDYVPSIQNVGPQTVKKLFQEKPSLEETIQALEINSRYVVDGGYIHRCRKAVLTFLHQRIYNWYTHVVEPRTPLPSNLNPEESDFLGPPIPAHHAAAIAQGDMDPLTRKWFDDDGHDWSDSNLSMSIAPLRGGETQLELSDLILKRSASADGGLRFLESSSDLSLSMNMSRSISMLTSSMDADLIRHSGSDLGSSTSITIDDDDEVLVYGSQALGRQSSPSDRAKSYLEKVRKRRSSSLSLSDSSLTDSTPKRRSLGNSCDSQCPVLILDDS